MTQGGPLSPTIFNVVVDAVLRHWVLMVVVTEGTVELGREGYGQELQWMVEYFYAKNGLLVSPWSNRLQWDFDILLKMFDRV